MFRSLKYRNFRLFFFGQFFSLCGSWMQTTAQAWLVYRLTKDPLLLGLIALVGQTPVFFVGFYSGILVDRMNHFRLVWWMQWLAMLQAAALALLALSGAIQAWHLFIFALVLGLIGSIDVPARQVLIGEMVEPEDRHNAIALNSTIVNAARIVGPGAAGLLIGWFGEGVCFAINAVSYLAVLSALAMMSSVRQAPPQTQGSMWEEIANGVAYALGHEPIRVLLFLLAVFGLAGLPIYVILPIFADDVLHSGAKGLGVLSSASGLGATIGALLLAWRKTAKNFGSLIIGDLMLFGAALIGLAFSRNFYLSCLFLWVIGFSAIQILAASNTLLQELSSDRFRGRIMSFYSMLFLGLSPVGSFIVGGVTSRIGVTATVAGQGLLCLLIAARYFARLPTVLKEEKGKAQEGLGLMPIAN